MVDPKQVEMAGKGGKPRFAMTGKCEVCGTNMYRIMGSADAAKNAA